MKRYEFVEGSSSKFWEIEISGASVTTRWGRIGTAGQEKTKDFASPAKAQAEYASLIREKTGKGYTLTGGGAAPPPAAPAPAPVAAASAPAVVPAAPAAKPAAPSPPIAAESEIPGEKVEPVGKSGPPEVWTDALRRKLHPRRSSGVQARPRKPAESLVIVREAWTSYTRKLWDQSSPESDELTRPILQLACARLEGDAPPPPGNPETEAAFFALVTVRSRWGPDTDDAVVDYWAGTTGAAFAVEALFGTLRIHPVADNSEIVKAVVCWKENRWSEGFGRPRLRRRPSADGTWVGRFADGVIGPWARLRRLLAATDEAEWEKARETAERLRAGANLVERIALAFLFPDVPAWAEEDAREVIAAGHLVPPAGCLFASLRDGELLERLMFLLCGSYLRLPVLEDNPEVGGDVAGLALAMAEGAGSAAVPALTALFEKCWWPKHLRACAEALAVVPEERSIAVLAARADVREVAPSVADAALRFPRQALPALAAEVARRGKAARACAPLLARLVRQHAGLAQEILPDLPEASRQVIEPLLGKADADWTEAPAAALPAVLARPPWSEKKRARKAGPVLRLDPIPQPDEAVWQEGQREEWLAMPVEGGESVRSDNAALRFMHLSDLRDVAQDEAALRSRITQQSASYLRAGGLGLLSERLAIILWEEFPPKAWSICRGDGFHRFIARNELHALPRLIEMAESRIVQTLPFLLPFRSSRVARLAATSLETRAARPAARRWLRTHPEVAALALVPLAVGPAGKERDTAGAALRFLAAEGQEAAVLTAALRYGDEAREAVAAVLAEDPLELFPAKLPKLPAFWQPEGFARPLLRDRRQALPLAAVEHLGTMLAFSRLDAPYAGLAQVKDACDPASLAAFAWDLFQAWLDAGAPTKEMWAFHALAHFGDDGCVRRLVPKIREWPAQQGFARAVAGLDVLAALGSDVALMHLHGIAQKAKHKPLQERAEERVEEIAERRGLTAEDLADRLVPDLGLGADGSLTLDFGPRAFRVGFDEYLKPFVCDAEGKRLTDLPKPGKGDDADTAARSQEVWKDLKKNVKAVATHQILRLELAMCRQRRWELEVFRTFFVQHPLLQHLVRRLIWGAWDGENRLAGTFRVTEDGSFADAADDAWEELPAGARVGVVHRLDLTDDLMARWGQVLADYEILQPFPQIGREVFRIEEGERDAKELLRHSGVTVHTGKVLSLDQRGWRRGPVLDRGIIAWMELPLPGGKAAAEVWLDPGIQVGSVADEPEQTIQEVRLRQGSQWSEHKLPFGTLDPITFSELVRDLEGLR